MNRRPDPPLAAAVDAGAIVARARDILAKEAEGMALLGAALDGALAEATGLVLGRVGSGKTGRLVVTGIGKSGHIAAKLASTFSSTGTPSLYLHAAEAAHGDLGMVGGGDVLMAISRSGDSRELYAVVDYCRAEGVPVIAVTMRSDSPLARRAAVVLRLPEVEEVCPNNLAPTTSALITLALGHVLAVLLMERRAFAEKDFAQFHPGGRLGRGLATVRRYIDEFGAGVPSVGPDAPMAEVISAVANGRKGSVVVLDPADGALRGIVTEGDLRRAYGSDMFARTAGDIMTPRPVTIDVDGLIREAVMLMTEKRIANIIVVDGGTVVEILDTKDLMERGFL
ncbi:MAG: KpsF/GutQ family sugar-phosphate isomerase [Bauldia sp.]|nr:KpsF/GutQ family sugar-phosphate isomerase [Bauldia sp.]